MKSRWLCCVSLLVLLCGCGQFTPKWPPQADAKQTVEVKLIWDGEGKIKLDGDAKIDVKEFRVPSSEFRANSICSCGCGDPACPCPHCGSAARAAATSQPGPRPSALSPQPKSKRTKITGLKMPGGKGVCPGCDQSAVDLKAADIDIDWETATGNVPGGWLPCFVWIGRDGQQHHWSPPTHQWLGQQSVNELLAEVNKTR